MKENYRYNDFSLEQIRNHNETRVIKVMQKEIPLRTDFCGCRLCVEDVYAFALNSIAPHYVQHGSLVLKTNETAEEDLRRVVLDGIDRVGVRPNHPDADA